MATEFWIRHKGFEVMLPQGDCLNVLKIGNLKKT